MRIGPQAAVNLYERMSRHPSSQQLEQYASRTLSPGLFLTVHRHVSACPVCHQTCSLRAQGEKDAELLLSALLSDYEEISPHLSREDVAAYLSGDLSEVEQEIAESHLELCGECRLWVEKLSRGQALKPVAAASSSAAAAGVLPHSRPAPQSLTWRIAAGVALLIGGALTLILFLRQPKTYEAGYNWPPPVGQSSPQLVEQVGQPVATPGAPTAQGTLPTANGQAPTVATPPRHVLSLRDGGQEVRLDEAGNLSGLESLPPGARAAVREALTARKIKSPEKLSDLRDKPGTLMGETTDTDELKLVGPVGLVVRGRRPVFRWQPLAGATSYTVVVTDAQLNEVATSGPLTVAEWRMPSELSRGHVYFWQVTARKNGLEITAPVLPAPRAKLMVLSQAEDEELNRLERSPSRSNLALGVLYARAGLLDDAERELLALVQANPKATVARQLLESVRDMKGRL